MSKSKLLLIILELIFLWVVFAFDKELAAFMVLVAIYIEAVLINCKNKQK